MIKPKDISPKGKEFESKRENIREKIISPGGSISA